MTTMKLEITADMARPHIEEAIARLGYVDAAKIDIFLAWFIKLWGRSPRSAAFYGTPRPIETLTEKGLKDPETAIDNTFWRAMNGLRSAMHKERDLRAMAVRGNGRGSMWGGLKFIPAPAGACDAANQIPTYLREHPALPLPTCDKEVCGCQWRMITTREWEKVHSG